MLGRLCVMEQVRVRCSVTQATTTQTGSVACQPLPTWSLFWV
ncbi:hypothetical protein MHYP_G00204930 [Metynnis hypsauchen]